MNDNGSGPTARPSPVPLIRLHSSRPPIEAMALDIERLRDLAQREGLIQVAYCLELARIRGEARCGQTRRDDAVKAADPRDLWRPEETG